MFTSDLIDPRPDLTELSRQAAERHAVLSAIKEQRESQRRTAGRRRVVVTRPRLRVLDAWLRKRRLS